MDHRSILMSVLAIGVAASMLGAGTFAYFSDTEESTGNEFQAGTLNLKLSNTGGEPWEDGVTATWSAPNWAPGDEIAAELHFLNVGTTGAKMLRVGGEGLVTDADMADKIEITEIWYTELGDWAYGDLVGYYTGVFGDGVAPLTLREFVESSYYMAFWIGGYPPVEDYLPAASGRAEKIKLGFKFMEDAGDEYQGKIASFTLRAIADDDTAILGKGDGCHGYA